MFFYTNQANQIRCSVTAITSRSHRGDRGSTPRFGVSFLFSRKIHMLIHLPLLFHCDATSHILLISIFFSIAVCITATYDGNKQHKLLCTFFLII